MINIVQHIKDSVIAGVQTLYATDANPKQVNIGPTRKEFEGDYTVVTFPFTKAARKKPEQIGEELGQYLVDNSEHITGFNVIKGFLNLSISDVFWKGFLDSMYSNTSYGKQAPTGKKVLVEFSSPNTNKPLHLGHIRNILLGWATAQIQAAAGNEVVKVQIINDRGIAICKSMLAWQKFGDNKTPQSTETKSDHFVGGYYVLFEQKFKAEYKLWQASEKGQAVFGELKKDGQEADAFFKSYKNKYFNEYSDLGKEAREMLLAWEAKDETVVDLWKRMNGWVYEGFDITYANLGVNFDKLYYESDTYLLGKDIVEQGLKSGAFYKKEDGSVWADLEDAKLDHKIVLRSDGTSVYMTQDLGTAQLRYKDFGAETMVYTVADEQDYHFKVLFEILKRLGEPYAAGLHHLSYGMVDLPSGKMKSREGTVVDADDLMAEVIKEATASTAANGDISNFSAEEQADIIRKIGMAALKYLIVKVNPKKRMIFDPKESVDIQGHTGPYIQYAYVRCLGTEKKAIEKNIDFALADNYQNLETLEKEILGLLYAFPDIITEAAAKYDPSLIANHCYYLARGLARMWHDLPILNSNVAEEQAFRVKLCIAIGNTLKYGMHLLGIEMPERM